MHCKIQQTLGCNELDFSFVWNHVDVPRYEYDKWYACQSNILNLTYPICTCLGSREWIWYSQLDRLYPINSFSQIRPAPPDLTCGDGAPGQFEERWRIPWQVAGEAYFCHRPISAAWLGRWGSQLLDLTWLDNAHWTSWHKLTTNQPTMSYGLYLYTVILYITFISTFGGQCPNLIKSFDL